ncbi:MAG: L-threonylcarbamoyladenylate synthase [Nitrospirota bacterium]
MEYMLLRLTEDNCEELIARGVSLLEQGGVIAYPTETFYGLGARYDNVQALERIFTIKRRPKEKTMPLIIGNVEQLSLLTTAVTDTARQLMERFWPGPLTILFTARPGLSEYIVAGGKVAVRVPGESFALQLARAASFPFTATSANPSSLPPATTAAAVADYFDAAVDLIVDDGETESKLPSTIVDATGTSPVVLREGALDIFRY